MHAQGRRFTDGGKSRNGGEKWKTEIPAPAGIFRDMRERVSISSPLMGCKAISRLRC